MNIDKFLAEYNKFPADFLLALWGSGILKDEMTKGEYETAENCMAALILADSYELCRRAGTTGAGF